jgi:hypothetical protein
MGTRNYLPEKVEVDSSRFGRLRFTWPKQKCGILIQAVPSEDPNFAILYIYVWEIKHNVGPTNGVLTLERVRREATRGLQPVELKIQIVPGDLKNAFSKRTPKGQDSGARKFLHAVREAVRPFEILGFMEANTGAIIGDMFRLWLTSSTNHNSDDHMIMTLLNMMARWSSVQHLINLKFPTWTILKLLGFRNSAEGATNLWQLVLKAPTSKSGHIVFSGGLAAACTAPGITSGFLAELFEKFLTTGTPADFDKSGILNAVLGDLGKIHKSHIFFFVVSFSFSFSSLLTYFTCNYGCYR